MAFLTDSIQTLTAAFSFGILLQAAAGGVFIYFKGHGSTILRDGRRLVLLAFLGFAALWAQIDFVTLLLPISSPTLCQGVLIFSTVLDQLARVALEQFLLWSIAKGTKVSLVAFVLQGILLVRLVAGGVLVGFSRPEFAPTCVAQTSLLPASIVVLSLDLIIIGFLIIRAISLGMFSDLRDKQSGLKKQQSKALILTTAGFVVWTATSVVMILGLSGFPLILRTAVPANGLLILVGMVTIFAGALLSAREQDVTTPEAQSPFIGPETSSRELPGGMAASGTPKSGNKFMKNGRLFIVNETPQDSSANYQTNQQRDTRGFSRLADNGAQFGLSDQDQSSASGHGPGYRGSSGIFGSIVAAPMIGRGQIAQNSRIALPASSGTRDAAVVKKSLFAWSSKPPTKTPIRTLGISRPIMANGDGSDDRPFSRIPTIDLATAARNEKERRDAAANTSSRPVFSKPIQPQPYVSPEEGLSKNVGIIRKEVPYSPNERLSTVRGSTSTSLLPMGGGSSTSASLSPGHEEVRRRSPRNLSSFDMKLDQKPIAPAKLQRKNTIGLPSNPRSQKAAMSKEIEVQKDTTIMRMNNIVYENPGAVRTIIRDAESSYHALKRPKTADQSSIASFTTTIKSANSMIHRPRPYRRESEKERALFPAEPSLGHKRSKSAGSAITSRSSIFSSFPGSPTALPPLPPMPRSASELKKLLPNDTKSMTFDEKIQLLFPAPPRSALFSNRRSSVPSVPRVPSMFISETPETKSPTNAQSNRTSKRTTIASFAMLAASSFEASSPKQQTSGGEGQRVSLSSEATSNNTNNLFDENRTFGNPRSDISTTPVREQAGSLSPALNLSLPLNFRRPVQNFAKLEALKQIEKFSSVKITSTVESDQDDASTDWGSIHSRIPVVDLREARKNARSTFIRGIIHDQNFTFQALPSPEAEVRNETDIIPVMLDDGNTDYSSYANSMSSRRSSARYENEAMSPIDKVPALQQGGSWHHRVGDQLPTFSERESRTRTRKMPPPTPLLLNRIGRSTNIVVHAAEPSPVESPERAIEEIKAQLERLEETDRGSIDFVSQQKDNRQLQIQDRLRLLETLEKEMDEQEDQWQHMNLDRNSMSTTVSSTPNNNDFSRNSSRRGSKRISHISSQHARVRSMQAKGDESSFTTSSQSSDNSRASIWQTRLAEAQLAYLENAPTLLRKSLNFLAMPNMQIASPTPPESEESGTDVEIGLGSESESEYESDIEYANVPQQVQMKAPAAKLWEYPPASPQATLSCLWNHPFETLARASTPEPPAKDIRPLQRFNVLPLQISSTNLWTKSSLSKNPRVVSGLWRSKVVRPKSILTKRASVRPKRKTRRMTILPDIVESPVPVPNKRETLGIFQFPWGETSDQPTYQPAFVAVPFSSFTASSRLNARSMELEPEGTEYTSSFFDDYDDEEDGDDEVDYEDSEDEFDENTLLDIADLLKSDEVPSRQSLFSPGAIVGDYADDTDFDSTSEVDEPTTKMLQAPIRLPIAPLSYSPKLFSPSGNVNTKEENPIVYVNAEPLNELVIEMEPSVEVSGMWTPQESRLDLPYTGLFSIANRPTVIRGTDLTPDTIGLARTSRNSNTALPRLSSLNLWSSENVATEDKVWISTSLASDPPVAAPAQSMWTLPLPKMIEPINNGLFSLAAQSMTTRTTNLEPAALDMIRKPRAHQSTLPVLESETLWNGSQYLPSEHHWITESSVSPPSPSMYSPSTGRTSPSSERSSFDLFDTASVRTASTKASTLWASMSTSTPTWWEPQFFKKNPSPTSLIPEFKRSALSPSDALAAREAELNSKIPKLRRQKSRENCQKATEAKAALRVPKIEENSEDEMSKKAQEMEFMSIRGSLRVAPRVMPMRQKGKPAYQRIKSSEKDWNAALSEAVAAGIKKPARSIVSKEDWIAELNKKATIVGPVNPKKERPTVTEVEWVAALNEAVTAGALHQPKRPTVSKDDWIAELNNKAIIIGPVYPKKNRPVVTKADWEAALSEAIEKRAVTQTRKPSLWTSPSETPTPSLTKLWSKTLLPKKPADSQIFGISIPNVRKTLPAENLEFFVLQSTELWQPTHTVSKEVHWLSSQSLSPAPKTWKPRKAPTPAPLTKLWSKASTDSSIESPKALFTHFISAPVKKSTPYRPATLQQLNSSELFTPIPEVEKPLRTHWLLRSVSFPLRRPVQSKGIQRSMTWAAPAQASTISEVVSGLWTPRSEPTDNDDTTTLSSIKVVKEPWIRKQRTMTTNLHQFTIQDSCLWKPSFEMHEGPKNWLVKTTMTLE